MGGGEFIAAFIVYSFILFFNFFKDLICMLSREEIDSCRNMNAELGGHKKQGIVSLSQSHRLEATKSGGPRFYLTLFTQRVISVAYSDDEIINNSQRTG